MHLAPGLVQLLGDLGARLAGADHEHGTVGKLSRPAVIQRVQLLDVAREQAGRGWNLRALVRPGREYDVTGQQCRTVGVSLEMTVRRGQAVHRGAQPHWRGE